MKRLLIVILGLSLCSTGFRPVNPATRPLLTPEATAPGVSTPGVATPDVATPDVSTPGTEPVKLSWEILRDVTFKKKWYAEESVYMLYPTFGPGIQKLNGKMVELTGYILPVDLDANLYVLSAFPYSACFFCGGAGPESVVSLKFKKAGRKFKTDERLTFRGTLKLNADNIYELNYIPTEAEIDS